jgi:hypothetical protein
VASANDCLSGLFRADARCRKRHRCAIFFIAQLLPLRLVMLIPTTLHHDFDHIPIHHDHQPHAYQTHLPLHKIGTVSHDITSDRIRSARQGRDLGDGAGSTCKEKDAKKTGTTQACGSSSLPRTLIHRLSYCHRQRLLN